MNRNLYQIVDPDREPMGLIFTNAPEEIIKTTWSKIYAENEPEDSSYVDLLVDKISEEDYTITRLFIEENIYP